MDEAAFQQLKKITDRVTTFLMRLLHHTLDLDVRHEIITEVNELTQNLVRANQERQGGD